MTDPAADAGTDPREGTYPVVSSEVVYEGKVIDVRRDMVRMPDGAVAQRDVVVHPGAVGAVALDDAGRIMLLRQYRHPVGAWMWEMPAGLLDKPHEPASLAAARELAEEAGLTATRWDILADVHSSPGMTDEAYRIFLARGIGQVPDGERFAGEHEEADLRLSWVDLDRAAAMVVAGEITNNLAVVGILSAARAREAGYAGLRPADSPWPARPDNAG